MSDVAILIVTMRGLGHEEGNSRREKMNKVEFHTSAGGP